MRKTIKSWIALLAIAVVGSYTSCKKTDKGITNATAIGQLKTMSEKYKFSDFPTMENGMLVFRDDNHYLAYIDFLDKNIEGIDSTDTVSDENSVLQEIEDGLKFRSLRSTTHADYEAQNEIGFPSLKDASEEHFVAAADIRSTLNADVNVRIGDAVLHYVSKDFAVRVDATDAELLNKYQGLSPDVSFEDLIAIDPEKYGSVIYELTGDSRIFGKGRFDKPTPLGDDRIQLPTYYFQNRCANPRTVTFLDLAYIQSGAGNVKGYFKINYGDGSAVENKTASYGGGHWRVDDFTHTYPNIGTYTMTITGSPNSNFIPSISTTMLVNVAGGAPSCAISYNETGWQYLYMGTAGGRPAHIGGKLVMQNIGSTSSPRLRVVAYTKFVKQNTDGSYSGFKGPMKTTLLGDVKDQDCNFVQTVTGSQENSSTKDQTLHRTPDYNASWTEFKSWHRYVTPSGGPTLILTLHPCD